MKQIYTFIYTFDFETKRVLKPSRIQPHPDLVLTCHSHASQLRETGRSSTKRLAERDRELVSSVQANIDAKARAVSLITGIRWTFTFQLQTSVLKHLTW